MTIEQLAVFGVLLAALILFVWGRWRYDAVAMAALLAAVLAGVVPPVDAFAGFGHPAVITVAAILVISRALRDSGIADYVDDLLAPFAERPTLQVAALSALVAAVSAFMNNVGALALFMPVAVQAAARASRPASQVLMPLSFGSLLGGLMTQIGTPPNIIVATFREQYVGEPFHMFDFTPVGAGVALAGVVFVGFLGWRLLPSGRKGATPREALFQIDDYIAEARVSEGSPLVGRLLREVEALGKGDVAIAGLVRDGRSLLAPSGFELLRAGDILILEADPGSLNALVDAGGMELAGSSELTAESLRSDDVGLMEAVVSPGSVAEGRTPTGLHLHSRYGLNLLAVSRQGRPIRERLGHLPFQVGDVLLLQGNLAALPETLASLGCLPLAERALVIGRRRRPALPLAIFGTAIALTTLGALPIQIAFLAAVGALVLFDLLPLRTLYNSIDWPVIVLLGAMIPVGNALQTTGGTELIATFILGISPYVTPTAVLALLLVATMLVTDVINNAATAVIMAPIAVGLANGLGASLDPFLMAVAVGSSCTFLTPIGHQSNTLVMGPGGYKFTDYWRMGLPLDALIVAVAVPLILWVWPM